MEGEEAASWPGEDMTNILKVEVVLIFGGHSEGERGANWVVVVVVVVVMARIWARREAEVLRDIWRKLL